MILYHGTAAALLPAIMARGLIPKAGKGADDWAMRFNPWLGIAMLSAEDRSRARSVFMTTELSVAKWFAEMAAQNNNSDPAILAVNLPDDVPVQRDEQGSMTYLRYEGKIPPAALAPLPVEAWADVYVPPLPQANNIVEAVNARGPI